MWFLSLSTSKSVKWVWSDPSLMDEPLSFGTIESFTVEHIDKSRSLAQGKKKTLGLTDWFRCLFQKEEGEKQSCSNFFRIHDSDFFWHFDGLCGHIISLCTDSMMKLSVNRHYTMDQDPLWWPFAYCQKTRVWKSSIFFNMETIVSRDFCDCTVGDYFFMLCWCSSAFYFPVSHISESGWAWTSQQATFIRLNTNV